MLPFSRRFRGIGRLHSRIALQGQRNIDVRAAAAVLGYAFRSELE